jgi:hypothetical protein
VFEAFQNDFVGEVAFNRLSAIRTQFFSERAQQRQKEEDTIQHASDECAFMHSLNNVGDGVMCLLFA